MARQATTSERQFRLYDSSLKRRAQRDIFVFFYLWRIFRLWITVGRKLRRMKREAAAEGRVLYVDEIMKGGST